MPPIARRATAAGLGTLAAFQLALAAGAPWGRASYGGGHAGVLPDHLRAVSAGATLVYSGLTYALVHPRTPASFRRRLLTGVVAVMGLATVVNGISRSLPERVIWTPVSALLAVTAWRARSDG